MSINVAWSGGFDSTAVVLFYLTRNRPVTPLSILLRNNEAQAREEIVALQNLYGAMWSYPDLRANLRGLRTSQLDLEVGFREPTVAPQAIIWGSLLPSMANEDEVALGYIRGDDFWHFRQLFENAFQSVARMAGRNIKLDYPLEWATLSEMVQIYAPYPRVFQAVSRFIPGGEIASARESKARKYAEIEKLFQVHRSDFLKKEQSVTLEEEHRQWHALGRLLQLTEPWRYKVT